MNQKSTNKVTFDGFINTQEQDVVGAKAHGRWDIECYDKDGNLKWKEIIENIVVNQGLDSTLSSHFGGSSVAPWYLGLTQASPTGAAGDTLSSHAGWNENTTYSESTRRQFNPGVVSSQSLSNSANRAQFSINGNTVVGGAFLTNDSVKGGATANKVLYSVGAFSGGNRSLVNGDTLNVQATFSQADDGV